MVGRRRIVRPLMGDGAGTGVKSRRTNARGEVWCYDHDGGRGAYVHAGEFRRKGERLDSYCLACRVVRDSASVARCAADDDRWAHRKRRERAYAQRRFARDRTERRKMADHALGLVPACFPSDAALSRATGVSTATVGKWRRESMVVPNRPTVAKIAAMMATLPPRRSER